jgi:hypothetical protein
MSLGIRLKGARANFILGIASLLFLTVSVVGTNAVTTGRDTRANLPPGHREAVSSGPIHSAA